MASKHKVSTSWDEDEYEDLKRYSKKKGLTPSQFLRMAAYQYMERYPQKRGSDAK